MHSFIPGKFISWYMPGRLFRPTYLPGRGQKTWPDAGVENEVENIAIELVYSDHVAANQIRRLEDIL